MTEKIREYNVVRQIRCTSSMQIRPVKRCQHNF